MDISKAEIASAVAASALINPQELRGAEILIKARQAEGVKHVWGYPGGAVLHIYDAFYKQDSIQHILVRHEQAAVLFVQRLFYKQHIKCPSDLQQF